MLDDFLNGSATDKQKYFLLMALVCDKLPANTVDLAVRAGLGRDFKSASVGLQNVKLGKVSSALGDLAEMVRLALPEFEIPYFLLPSTHAV